jgi:hypothetical protein
MLCISVKRFRLACRLFSAIGMRRLAIGAYLFPTKSSMKGLADLSQTKLSKSITSLSIAAERFDFCHTYEEWKYLKVPLAQIFDLQESICRARGSHQSRNSHGKCGDISANMPEESRPHYELGITAKILETFQARVLKHLQISFVPLKAIARETNGSYLMSVRAVMPFLESLALGVAYEPTKPENENGHEYWPDKSCLI